MITIKQKEWINHMNKNLKWVGILALTVILVACQSEKVDPLEGGQTLKVQQGEQQKHEHEHHHDLNHNHEHNDDHDYEDAHHHGTHEAHHHPDDEQAKQIYAGYFEDDQIQPRELSDWAGDWQSVYPYLLDGTLDEVFDYKANKSDTMTTLEYKQYYDVGYKTTVDRIVIEGDKVTFYEGDRSYFGQYKTDGYEVLTYEKGNRGVRYIFTLVEPTPGVPTYIQFSDHRIYPTIADHYHIYWGDDRAALLSEVVNWPTYYPSSMDGHTIAHEMMAH